VEIFIPQLKDARYTLEKVGQERALPFKGLFIGIDRYASPGIDWLSCARRDAAALHGLFTDTMGGETVLLTDGQATRAATEDEFRRLETAATDDVVVVTFSGHGSETHELIAYDTGEGCVVLTASGADPAGMGKFPVRPWLFNPVPTRSRCGAKTHCHWIHADRRDGRNSRRRYAADFGCLASCV